MQKSCKDLSFYDGPSIFHLCGKLKNLLVSKRNCPTFPDTSSGSPLRVFWVFHSPLITVIEDWINLSVPEIIIQSFWFWCCFQTDYCQQTCNPSLLWNFSCITRLHKVIWLNQCISNKPGRADIEEKSLKKVLCNIQINMQPHFGNSCCRDVRGGYDWRNFYSESIQTCTPVIHLSMLYSEKHTSVQHNRFPAMLDVILIPKRFSWPVFHVPAVIGAGQQCITGSQRYGRQRALERADVKPKPPTLTDTWWSITESQASKRQSNGDIMCSCCSFLSPPSEKNPVSSLIFVPRVLQMSTRAEWSAFESPRRLSVLLCLTHECTWTHTLSLLSFSLGNQTAGCSQVVWEGRAVFHFSDPCWAEYSHFPHNQVTEWTGSHVKRWKLKGKHKSIAVSKNTIPFSWIAAQMCSGRVYMLENERKEKENGEHEHDYVTLAWGQTSDSKCAC